MNKMLPIVLALALVGCARSLSSVHYTSTGALLEHFRRLTLSELQSEFRIVKREYERAINSLVRIECDRPPIFIQKQMLKENRDPMMICRNHHYGYQILLPTKYSETLHSEDPFGVITGPGFFDDDDGISGKIYVRDFLPCSFSSFGIGIPMHESREEGAHFLWGKVDLFDRIGLGDIVEYNLPVECPGYLLCSQKEEKTVVICILQKTDNPGLAAEIFETFRWMQ